MSKKRNNHLRRALELACQELDKYRHTSESELRIRSPRITDPEYWYTLSCTKKPVEDKQPHENL